ncbi:MAG: hypothetical protein H7330_05500 [Hymenobacteraceae bacterium]|nr:hypothetical protein [Hymenobacteraceae bacterium]
MRKFLYENGLTLVLVAITLTALVGHAFTGWHQFNDAQRDFGQATIGLTAYLTTGHFVESVFENWESEFLQMGCYVMFTIWLRQKGASDSKSVDDSPAEVDREPERARQHAPGPVRRGGWQLWLYRRSLTLALFSLFIISFWLHAYGAARNHNHEAELKGKPAHETTCSILSTSEFWFQSLENWQSEFLSVATLVAFSIFLRQHGSPESKPVDAAHDEMK